jgi:5-formyltetrahydrofolate cyclo-ligase
MTSPFSIRIVSGNVAVTEQGVRIGKGEGYSDLAVGTIG